MRPVPPRPGDQWRINFSRGETDTTIIRVVSCSGDISIHLNTCESTRVPCVLYHASCFLLLYHIHYLVWTRSIRLTNGESSLECFVGSGSQALRQGPSRPEREQLGVVASVGGADAQAGDVGICAGEAAGLQKGGDVWWEAIWRVIVPVCNINVPAAVDC